MQKSYTVKILEKIEKPKDNTIKTLLNFSKSLEIIKMSSSNVELTLN